MAVDKLKQTLMNLPVLGFQRPTGHQFVSTDAYRTLAGSVLL